MKVSPAKTLDIPSFATSDRHLRSWIFLQIASELPTMAQAQQDYYRQAFELITGAIADRRWRQIQNELKRSGMKINVHSVQNYAQFKLFYPRTVLTKSAVKALEEFQAKYQGRKEFLGEELLGILHQVNPRVTERSLINAFYKARLPFSKQNIYTIEEASKIVFFAAITRRK